ncbi:RNI-like superfamily protein [Euphorbia peplus]|nr:RNI-like superfamily protein [Euphorbia peplus]
METINLQKNGRFPPRWEDLNMEILALILVRLPTEQRLGPVSFVCKNWSACVSGPYCWSEINIHDWCCKRLRSIDEVHSAACDLMKRSRGAFKLLSAYRLGSSGFEYAANCGKFLKVLKIPRSDVSDKMVEKHAESLVNLSELDISYCLKITSKGIEEFGNKCKHLIHLTRNLPPPADFDFDEDFDFEPDDREAMVIANTMTGLKKLELCSGSFGDLDLQAILTNCKALTHLNIERCRKVRMDGELLSKCLKLESFIEPGIYEQGDYDDYDHGYHYGDVYDDHDPDYIFW